MMKLNLRKVNNRINKPNIIQKHLQENKDKAQQKQGRINQSSTTFSAIGDYTKGALNNNKFLKYALRILRKYFILAFLEYYKSKKKISMMMVLYQGIACTDEVGTMTDNISTEVLSTWHWALNL